MRNRKYIGIILLVGIILMFSPARICASSSEKSGSDTSGKSSGLSQLIRQYHFDADNEKKKLAEAINKLDELGFSPEKLVGRFRDFFSRKENRKKVGEAAGNLKEDAGKLLEQAGVKKKDTETGKESSAESSVEDTIKEEASRQLDKIIDQAAEKAGELAAKEIDKAAETAGDLAAEEISRAAEKMKEEVR